MTRLATRDLTLGYGDRQVVHEVSVAIPDGKVTVVVGPNACGKSTLLKGLARLVRPQGGVVLLDGEAIHRRPTKEVAKVLGEREFLVERSLVGSYLTALDMAGCSLTMLVVDDELVRLWDAPVSTSSLRWGA